MTVYFEPERKSWLDYAAPIVAQLIGSGMERTNQAKAYELQKRTAQEEIARQQQQKQWALDQAASMGPIGRDDPSGAMDYLAKLGILDDNANPAEYYNAVFPKMERSETALGDRTLVDIFNPGTGNISGKEYTHGVDPTKELESVNELEGRRVLGDAQVRAAQANASRPYAPRAERKPAALRPIQTDEGIMLLNPETGEIIPTGYKPPQKTGSAGSGMLKTLAEADQGGDDDDGFWSRIFGGGKAQAAQTQQLQPPASQPQLPAFASKFRQGAALGLWPEGPAPGGMFPADQGTEEKIGQMMKDTGLPREQVIAYLMQNGII